MDRKIKFRVWLPFARKPPMHRKYGRMIYLPELFFCVSLDGQTHPQICSTGHEHFYLDTLYEAERSAILLQYTGLKDKNGVEIYEGDFLEEEMYVRWCDVQGSFECWLPNGYCMACNGDMHWYEVAAEPESFEVQGNLYENPFRDDRATVAS